MTNTFHGTAPVKKIGHLSIEWKRVMVPMLMGTIPTSQVEKTLAYIVVLGHLHRMGIGKMALNAFIASITI